jgi:AmmeMemoRadiSam system protein B
MIRKPAVAGQFYNSSPVELSEEIRGYIADDVKKEHAIGIVSPHAGIMYSGKVAGAVFSAVEFPQTFILVGPNHTGLGNPVSIMSSGVWQIPTGELHIDEKLANYLKMKSDIFREDKLAHTMEHSLEVQLPFIIHFSSDVNIVPIAMMTDSVEDCRLAGEAIADAVKNAGYPVVVAASSDMSHYVSDSAARSRDKMAIDKIISLDPEGLYETVRHNDISMCGVIPVTTMLFAAKKLGAKEAGLVKYMTSGEISGDKDYVVGYAGMLVK